MSIQSREHAALIFHSALARSTVKHAAASAFRHQDNTLFVQDQTISLHGISRIFITAIGKAAAPLFDAVRSALPENFDVRSVISATTRPAALSVNDQFFLGGHPQPTLESVRAAEAALVLLGASDASTLVIFLITGGASAMFELPISQSISLDDLVTLNRALVASGAPIREINCVRKHFSAVKGGRLALAAGDAKQISTFISDVPLGQLDTLASGPTLIDSTTVEECLSILRDRNLIAQLPSSIAALIEQEIMETPKQFPNAYPPIVLLDNAHLVDHAAKEAARLGYEVVIDSGCDDWDAVDAAEYLLHRLNTHTRGGKPLCLISGGEVTVTLPLQAAHGVGGRNQHFVLACLLQQRKAWGPFTVLSAGSDGVDGNSPAAGAIVDETTLARAEKKELKPQVHFERFDSYTFFHALGDDIVTGPTGNNLRDLRILLRD
jgi:glycerate 2-kinase